MNSRTKAFLLAIGFAAALPTAAFADTGTADNTNAVVGGDTNQPAERLMERGATSGPSTGAGRGDNTNAITANPDDFMQQNRPRRADTYAAPSYAPSPSYAPAPGYVPRADVPSQSFENDPASAGTTGADSGASGTGGAASGASGSR